MLIYCKHSIGSDYFLIHDSLCLCVRQNALQLSFFFLFLFLDNAFDWTDYNLLCIFNLFLLLAHVTNIELINTICRVLSSHVLWRQNIMVDLRENMWNLSLQLIKVLYLYYQNAHVHQTWQSGDLPWWTPTYAVIWPFDFVVLWDEVTH